MLNVKLNLNIKIIVFLALVIIGIYTTAMLFMAVFNLVKLHKELDEFKIADIDYSVLRDIDKKEPKCFNLFSGQGPIAVIIDNGIGAGKPHGLSQADLIIEAPVEGGITRFLAFFDSQKLADKIGPVRSARPYFADFAEEWQAKFAHSGGSPQALAELKSNSYNLINIDEIGPDGRYFWRDRRLPAPHNLFTSLDLLKKAGQNTADDQRQDSIACNESSWIWEEKLKIAIAAPDTPDNVVIDYSIKSYQAEYKYNQEKQSYIRYQGGREFTTAEERQIIIDNVLIAFMGVKVIDSEARLKIQTTGEGKAVICQLGDCKDGEWSRTERNQIIKFYVDNQEVKLMPGKTWLNIVPVGRRAEY